MNKEDIDYEEIVGDIKISYGKWKCCVFTADDKRPLSKFRSVQKTPLYFLNCKELKDMNEKERQEFMWNLTYNPSTIETEIVNLVEIPKKKKKVFRYFLRTSIPSN